jgi:hypothetical protein
MALRGVDLEAPRGDLVEECPHVHDARWERGSGGRSERYHVRPITPVA